MRGGCFFTSTRLNSPPHAPPPHMQVVNMTALFTSETTDFTPAAAPAMASEPPAFPLRSAVIKVPVAAAAAGGGDALGGSLYPAARGKLSMEFREQLKSTCKE